MVCCTHMLDGVRVLYVCCPPVLPHPLNIPDLTPYDFHIFDPLKDTLRGRRFTDDDDDNDL